MRAPQSALLALAMLLVCICGMPAQTGDRSVAGPATSWPSISAICSIDPSTPTWTEGADGTLYCVAHVANDGPTIRDLVVIEVSREGRLRQRGLAVPEGMILVGGATALRCDSLGGALLALQVDEIAGGTGPRLLLYPMKALVDSDGLSSLEAVRTSRLGHAIPLRDLAVFILRGRELAVGIRTSDEGQSLVLLDLDTTVSSATATTLYSSDGQLAQLALATGGDTHILVWSEGTGSSRSICHATLRTDPMRLSEVSRLETGKDSLLPSGASSSDDLLRLSGSAQIAAQVVDHRLLVVAQHIRSERTQVSDFMVGLRYWLIDLASGSTTGGFLFEPSFSVLYTDTVIRISAETLYLAFVYRKMAEVPLADLYYVAQPLSGLEEGFSTSAVNVTRTQRVITAGTLTVDGPHLGFAWWQDQPNGMSAVYRSNRPSTFARVFPFPVNGHIGETLAATILSVIIAAALAVIWVFLLGLPSIMCAYAAFRAAERWSVSTSRRFRTLLHVTIALFLLFSYGVRPLSLAPPPVDPYWGFVARCVGLLMVLGWYFVVRRSHSPTVAESIRALGTSVLFVAAPAALSVVTDLFGTHGDLPGLLVPG
jgi:hypothetical protein